MYTDFYMDIIYIIMKLYRIICGFYILLKFMPLISRNSNIVYLTICISQPFFKLLKGIITFLKLKNYVKGYYFLFFYFGILNEIVNFIDNIRNLN
jgi:hypothetical protein